MRLIQCNRTKIKYFSLEHFCVVGLFFLLNFEVWAPFYIDTTGVNKH